MSGHFDDHLEAPRAPMPSEFRRQREAAGIVDTDCSLIAAYLVCTSAVPAVAPASAPPEDQRIQIGPLDV